MHDPKALSLATLLACPWCRSPVESQRDYTSPVIILAEPVVCPRCHGIAIDSAGQLRSPTALELANIDWPAYHKCCKELRAAHGAPRFPLPHKVNQ